MEESEARVARIRVSMESDRNTVIEIDGKTARNVEAFTLQQRVGNNPTLDLRRVLSPPQARARGMTREDILYREDVRITLARIEIEGAVQLIDDAMRAALDQARGSALDAFMMEAEGQLAYSLGDILRDAARYRAIRACVDAKNGCPVLFEGLPVPNGNTSEEATDGGQLDDIADELRARVRGDDGYEQFERDERFARTVDVDGVLHRAECNAVRSPSDIVENISKPCNCGAIEPGATS